MERGVVEHCLRRTGFQPFRKLGLGDEQPTKGELVWPSPLPTATWRVRSRSHYSRQKCRIGRNLRGFHDGRGVPPPPRQKQREQAKRGDHRHHPPGETKRRHVCL